MKTNNILDIPKANEENSNFPCWIPISDINGINIKPIIRCKCGEYYGIGTHEIKSSGMVHPSVHHKNRDGKNSNDNKGCGFHHYIRLLDWDGSIFK